MKRQLMIMALGAVAVFAATAPTANAQNGCGYGGGGCWDNGYGWMYNTLRYEVPHFAAFPPVYYSEPVPRTYGYSPFAYGPNVMTPDVVGEAQPLTINNPYVPTTQPASAPANANPDRSTSVAPAVEPLVVINPYVTQRGTVADSSR